MSNNHAIVAQPWQLKSNLGAVLMPLLPEPKFHDKVLVWTYKDSWYWKTGETIGKHFYDSFAYKAGDRIYLQEEWFEHDDGYEIKSLWKESSEYSDDSEWNPAHTMPREAAQFWYEITSVEVTQAKDLDMPTLIESKLTYWGNLREDPRLLESEVVHYWNKCHPEHPWYGDRYVVILRIRFCSPKAMETAPEKATAFQFLVPHESGKGYYAIAVDESGKFITGAIVKTRRVGEADLNTNETQHHFFCDRRFHYGWGGFVLEFPPDNWDGQKLPTKEQMQIWENRPEYCKDYHYYSEEPGVGNENSLE